MDKTEELEWQGAELAFAQLRDRLNQIQLSLQPVRGDIITRATQEALDVVEQLQRYWEGQPPGAFQPQHKQFPPPPTGGATQPPQRGGREWTGRR